MLRFAGIDKVSRADSIAASCESGIRVPESRCDGLGSCPTSEPIDCGGYACVGNACGTACSSDADCVGAYRCLGGSCGAGAECDGSHTLTEPDGTRVDCSPYRCTESGLCLGACGGLRVTFM